MPGKSRGIDASDHQLGVSEDGFTVNMLKRTPKWHFCCKSCLASGFRGNPFSDQATLENPVGQAIVWDWATTVPWQKGWS